MSERTEKLRKQFDNMRNRGELAEHCGVECVGCGAMEAIEYHHILPIALGGDNRYRNIVPLCFSCHMKIHGKNLTKLSRWVENTGRPKRKAPEGYEKVLPLYFEGKMTWAEVREQLNLGSGQKARECWWVEDYAKQLGIDKYVRIRIPYERVCGRVVVAKIWYKDGRITQTWFYKENGKARYEVEEIA